jgi:hypothetical protein
MPRNLDWNCRSRIQSRVPHGSLWSGWGHAWATRWNPTISSLSSSQTPPWWCWSLASASREIPNSRLGCSYCKNNGIKIQVSRCKMVRCSPKWAIVQRDFGLWFWEKKTAQKTKRSYFLKTFRMGLQVNNNIFMRFQTIGNFSKRSSK